MSEHIIDFSNLVELVNKQAAQLDAVRDLVRYLDRLAPGDKHYAGLISAALDAS